MDKIYWQLPTHQSSFNDYDYIRPNAKFHAFKNCESLCKRHRQADWFEQYDFYKILDEFGTTQFCKICLKKYLKIRGGIDER